MLCFSEFSKIVCDNDEVSRQWKLKTEAQGIIGLFQELHVELRPISFLDRKKW